jgi:uncharacterized protein (TIGR03435 family)
VHRGASVAAVFAAASFNVARAQMQTDAGRPAFEVASVKPDTAENLPTFGGMRPGGHLLLINVPLRVLIRNAYQVQDKQLVGPTWMSSDRYDIEAKAGEDLPLPRPGKPAPTQSMMQTLLADRFKLVVHEETAARVGYSLEIGRSDGTLGRALHHSHADCAAIAQARQRAGSQAPPPQTSDESYCGFESQGTLAAGGHMKAGGFPVSQLTGVLSQMLQEIVVDNTGLAGDFDWALQWAADRDSDGPSLFTALREQLGLTLQHGSVPVRILVVDHVERPRPD